MEIKKSKLHSDRMKELVKYTSTSFELDFPSPFGAAIYDTNSNSIIAQSVDTVMKNWDPTNHAEVNTIRIATKKIKKLSLKGCVLYSTCEPCPMCMSAIIWAEIDTVVFGASTMEDANAYWPQPSDVSPQELSERILFSKKCEVIPNVERSLCKALFENCDQQLKERELKLPPNR